jgi:energy-coupling factor transporter ATP-binding protein EcfA2
LLQLAFVNAMRIITGGSSSATPGTRWAALQGAGARFKSFVEPAELRIEPGLTGVVGPNGCGKSNLLEAIRWVMGESSPKSMRGGGMEDVIFAGTASRPPRDFAEVVLHCDTGDADRNWKSSAGSNAARAAPTASTGAMSGPRTWRWSLPTPPPARTPRAGQPGQDRRRDRRQARRTPP